MSEKITEVSSTPAQPAEMSNIIDFQAKRARKHGEKSPEAVDEDALLSKMKAASLILGTRQERSWNTIRDLAGTVLGEDDEGGGRFQDLRVPRKKLDSQRATINQLRGRIQKAIKDGSIREPDDIVPWFETSGEEEDAYTSQREFLESREVEKIIKEYTPLIKTIESFKDEASMKSFFDSLDERTSVIIDLIQRIRQIRHDHAVFLQLFHKDKNPAFLSAFEEHSKDKSKKPAKLSKERRERKRVLEMRPEVSPGAQMRFVLEYEGGKVVFERVRDGLKLTQIDIPARIVRREEQEQFMNKTFAFDLHDAPEWIKEIMRKKGLM